MTEQKPSVGRIVHITNADCSCYAAMITWVNQDQTVSLKVSPPGGHSFPIGNVEHGDGEGRWHWPERV